MGSNAVDQPLNVLCGDPACPRHRRDQFNPAAKCTDPPPAHWTPTEKRRWFKQQIATPRSNYGIASVPDSYNRRPR